MERYALLRISFFCGVFYMNCEFCGKPSGRYSLCRDCYELKENGEIEKCEDCGEWHYADEPCECESEDNGFVTTPCIICGAEANGYWFCRDCYRKYKNKEILLRIRNCTEVEFLDDTYEGKYICADGHIVKSKSEREIDNYLFSKGIFHVYEKPFPIDEDSAHDLHPDFYLPKEDIYIEFWGYDDTNIKYAESKNYKLDIYRKRKITLICMYEKTDAKDINTALDRKLALCEKGKINFEEKTAGDFKQPKNEYKRKKKSELIAFDDGNVPF